MSTAPRLAALEPTFAELFTPGLKPPLVRYAPSDADARMAARHHEEVDA